MIKPWLPIDYPLITHWLTIGNRHQPGGKDGECNSIDPGGKDGLWDEHWVAGRAGRQIRQSHEIINWHKMGTWLLFFPMFMRKMLVAQVPITLW